MSIKDNHNRKVTFDTGDELGGMIDKLTVMTGRLAAKVRESGRQFKPQIYQVGEEDKIEKVMIDVIMISKITKLGIGHIVDTGKTSTGKILEVD